MVLTELIFNVNSYTYFVYVNLDLKLCFALMEVRSVYGTYHTLHSNTGVTGVKNSKLKTLSLFPF